MEFYGVISMDLGHILVCAYRVYSPKGFTHTAQKIMMWIAESTCFSEVSWEYSGDDRILFRVRLSKGYCLPRYHVYDKEV